MDPEWEWTEAKAREASHMLDDLESPRKVLNAWEQEFVESVSDQYGRNFKLSERQFDVLKRIHGEKA